MRLLCIVVILLLFGTATATIQLGGPSGQTILESLKSSSNPKATDPPSGLWEWGSMPLGHVLQNGSLAEGPIVNVENGSMESPMQAAGLNDYVEAGSNSQSGGAIAQSNSQGGSNWPQMTVNTPVSHSANGFFDSTTAIPPVPCKN